MSGANSEQLKAIEHFGGVQLQAGAGSGKTFVLQQHAQYLIRQQIFNQSGELVFHDATSLRAHLKSYLSKIVLMTFTKKAAGELEVRVHAQIKKQVTQWEIDYGLDKFNPWVVVLESINYMTISTIDGFCYKLISKGYITNINPNISIIQGSEYSNKMNTLIHQWCESELENFNPLIVDLIESKLPKVVEAVSGIFSDPDLRIMWSSLSPESFEELSFKQMMSEIFKLTGADEVLNLEIDQLELESKKPTKLQEYFIKHGTSFCKIPTDLEEWEWITDFFAQNGLPRMPGKGKEKYPTTVVYLTALKKFYETVKTYSESIIEYLKHRDGVLVEWMRVFKHLIDYVELNYDSIEGVTFADLEYYVLQGLKDESTQEMVSRDYHYLIVDEFQDTSFVQFDIIEKVIKSDYSKLFTVGDIKQAIYGFKGGEIKVFKQCQEKTPLNLELANNYRSEPWVIKFNNHLFDFLFAKGKNYEGDDIDPVEVSHQTQPEREYLGEGKICKTTVSLSSDADEALKLSAQELNDLEAEYIFERIKELKEEYPSERVAILYKSLKPSMKLIDILMKHKIGFTAQIKVALKDDPIMSIFSALVEHKFDQRKDTKYLELTIKAICSLLGLSSINQLKEKIEMFYLDAMNFGISLAFQSFCAKLKIANSNRSNNLQKINSLCVIATNWEHLYNLLNDGSEEKYSIDFQTGENPSLINILTAHASKGLQYAHVILGGIQNNGRQVPDFPLLGKLPGSLRWFDQSDRAKALRTPMNIIESLFNQHKNFAEAKRLFYVTCTRAERSISWIDFDIDKESIKTIQSKDSWIFGIRKFEEEYLSSLTELDAHIASQVIEKQKVISPKEDEIKVTLPLFHINPLGISEREDQESNFGIIPELSVTRLAQISHCPRKFYLMNHLKIDKSEIELFFEESTSHFDLKEVEIIREGANDFIEKGESASERGTRIHLNLSEMIINDMTLPLASLNSKEKETYQWVKDELLKLNSKQIFSEVDLKFPFFGHTISGTPDLFFQDSEDSWHIWDFKTGTPSEEKELPYWFQLKTYALALYNLDRINRDETVELSLVYVDKQQINTVKYSFEQVYDELYKMWLLTNRADILNLEHCPKCPYAKICEQS